MVDFTKRAGRAAAPISMGAGAKVVRGFLGAFERVKPNLVSFFETG
jgi:hypothetical protein